MNAKERFYSGMARETISKITANKDNWTACRRTNQCHRQREYRNRLEV